MLLCINSNIFAQDKISYDLSVGVNQSIGKDVLKRFDDYTFSWLYYSRRKYNHPTATALITASYPLSHKFYLGLKSGVYIHFLEQYLSGLQRTTVSIPLTIVGSYKLKEINKKPFKVELSIGGLFFKIKDRLEQYTDAKLGNLSFVYKISNISDIKFGIEEQVDNVSFSYLKYDVTGPNVGVFNYTLNRTSLILSYSINLK